MQRRVIFAVILIFLGLLACKKSPTSGPSPTKKAADPPPAPPQAPIRNNATQSEFKNGAAVSVRMFVSTLTPEDPVRFGFTLVSDSPVVAGHPWLGDNVDWTESVPTFVFELKTPSGKKEKFQVAD